MAIAPTFLLSGKRHSRDNYRGMTHVLRGSPELSILLGARLPQIAHNSERYLQHNDLDHPKVAGLAVISLVIDLRQIARAFQLGRRRQGPRHQDAHMGTAQRAGLPRPETLRHGYNRQYGHNHRHLVLYAADVLIAPQATRCLRLVPQTRANASRARNHSERQLPAKSRHHCNLTT